MVAVVCQHIISWISQRSWFREDRLPGKKARNRMKWSLTAGHSYRCEQNQKWRGPREEANQGESCWLKDRLENTQGLKHNRETEPAGIMFKSGIVSRRKRYSVIQPQSLWRMSTSTLPNDLYGFSRSSFIPGGTPSSNRSPEDYEEYSVSWSEQDNLAGRCRASERKMPVNEYD